MSILVEALKDPETRARFDSLTDVERAVFEWRSTWLQVQAHGHQLEPVGEWWSIWLMLAGRGAGKLLCIDTPIPNPSGWIRNGDLRAGDTIFDERGRATTVTVAHDVVTPEKCYRVTFSDGSTLDAGGEHLWSTLTHRDRKQMTRHGIKRVPLNWPTYKHPLMDCHGNVTGFCGAEVRSTEEIRATLTHSTRKDLNHCIPTARPLELPEATLPIDPWLLGAWLGDGSSKEQVIWCHTNDLTHLRDRVNRLGYQSIVKHDKGNVYGLRVLGMGKELKALGVFGDRKEPSRKHVPAQYLRASAGQRLSLLQGLMDSDGYQSSKGCEFSSTKESLAKAVFELAASLGEKPVLAKGVATLYGKDCGPKYRVTWRWSVYNPFSLPRKVNKCVEPKVQAFKHGHRMIVSIDVIPAKPMRCITVDSPSALYLAGESMIPTHNTRAAAETLAHWAWQTPKTRWLVSAPTSSDLRGTCFEGDSGLLSVIPPILIAKDGYNKSLHEIKLINGSFIKGIPASEPDRFRGPQFHGGWLDELAAWDYLQDSWDMIQFGIRLGQRTKLICSTTPKPKPVVMDLIFREGKDVTITRASTYSNLANLAPSFQKQILQYEGTNLGRQEIHAEIIDPEEGGIVQRKWFKMWPSHKPFPKLEYILQSYDCATSDKTINDPTGSITLGVFKPLDGGMCVLVLDCWQEHLQYPDLRPKVIEEFETIYGEGKDKKRVDLLLVEDKSAGISLIQDLQRAHLPVHAYNPGKADKIQRLSIVANIIKAGRVWVPESSNRPGFVRDWAEGMVSQICSFPEGTIHDEFVDCISQGLRYLRDAGWISIDGAPRDDLDEDDYVDAGYRQRENPYSA